MAKRRMEPTGWPRLAIAAGCLGVAIPAGWCTGWLVVSLPPGPVFDVSIGTVILAITVGVLVTAIVLVWLCWRAGIEADFSVPAAGLTVLAAVGHFAEWRSEPWITLACAALLILFAVLTDPGRGRAGRRQD